MVIPYKNPAVAYPLHLLHTCLLGVALLLLTRCGGEPQKPPESGFLIVLRSDLNPETELERVLIETVRHGGERRIATLEMGPNDPQMPLSFVINAEPQDMEQGLTLHVSAFGPGRLDPIVRRSARLQFISNKLLRLVIDLSRACTTRYADCEAVGDTCEGNGHCIDWDIDANDLPRVTPGEELNALPLFPEPASDLIPPTNTGGKTGGQQPVSSGGMHTSSPEPSPDAGTEPDAHVDSQSAPDATTQDAHAPKAPTPDATVPDAAITDASANPTERDATERDATEPDATVPDATIPGCPEGTIRCMAGTLRTCVSGDFGIAGGIECQYGCHEGSSRCNACGAGDQRCAADAIQDCSDGFWKPVQACDLGCSSLAPHCLECIGPAKRCDDEGQLSSCQLDGLWLAAECFGNCLDPDDASDDAGTPASADLDASILDTHDAGTFDASDLDDLSPTQVTCSPCNPADRRCTGRDILTCSADGYADAVGCNFGCVDPSDCREDTPLGQALLTTVLD